ncbi:internal scaffolding protein [Sigmofec virus UA08Rod_5306]|uniref:Internal scaffolding protein n=1 Tax=Sigmofec virus UA08Rod_5306 TaxID=2929417 RepID=A0A976N1J9_9VIRU|nr:internal scaffolding protein [Sigmofec virus UA08Rod_5306]
MKFYNRSEHAPRQAAPAGEKQEPVYEMDVDLYGHKFLVETGKTNIYERIQESLEETKIENIIRRALGGDEEALRVMHGTYTDVTNAPKSLAEMQQLIIKANQDFEKLPIEVREKFNHDPMQFIAEWGSEEWTKKMERPKTLGELQKEAAEKAKEGGEDK